ncbi:hypothetical protein CFOL_v3_32960 [Cephalotus follicularis]|uniref:GDP-D-glucose phosphorylase 1 n=1 Tax=Cephalotus follicularis TaxID=3775 RepID=A0A1Q3DAJ4_CEPFO|nr:hypothetical protein CFOL_v3_32960 [Cephalotus follicularis]
MLTIKRVPTVVSNYQEESSEKVGGCGRNCLGQCCLPLSELPLYAFKRDTENSSENGVVIASDKQPQISCFLYNLLLAEWEDRKNQGLFRYNVTACETKIIPSKYGFIAQLNEGRHNKKRPTEFRVDKVLQPFDENKFNFTKIGQEEVLFRFEPSNDNKSHFFSSAPLSADSSSPSVVAINVSPIEYGHVLLIPRVLDCLPQRIDHECFLLALHMAKEAADPFFRLGYNSLGAFATINHLHFQAYYLLMPFPIEKAFTRRINTAKGLQDRGVKVLQLLDYPVRGLVFEAENSMKDLSDVVARSCIFLQNDNIPFNVLIADCGQIVFLFPQCYAEKQALGKVSQELLDTHVNPAVWEISGHIVLKRKKDFEDLSEAYASRLLAEVSLSEERFQEVKAYILEAANLQEKANMEDNGINQEEDSPCKIPCRQNPSHLPQDCVVLH